MSIADELAQEDVNNPRTSEWFAEWRASLDDADRVAVDAWLTDPHKPAVALFRVCRKYGYTGAETTFREWVVRQRRGDS